MPELLQHWVTRAAERSPDAVAAVLGSTCLTYAELEETSNRLANALVKAGCRRHDRVCLLMPKSPMAIAAILGVLKADAMYVPLDPANPPARLAKILGACDTPWVLAEGPVSATLSELSRAELPQPPAIGWLDAVNPAPSVPVRFSLDDLADYASVALDADNHRQDPAYILFTSGSTGEPKGVVITHASVVTFVEWAIAYFGMSAADRVSGHAPLHFDLSTFDMFGTFAVGAELHLVPPELNVFPLKLSEFIRTAALTQWFSVPSILTYLARFDAVRYGDFPDLRRVLWCGEVFPTPALIHWMRRLPHATFTNLYGPTEATIASSYYTVPRVPDDPSASVPIGTACAGEDLLVLDEARQPVGRGEIGDLYIRGAGLSPGYWRDPDRTASAFFSDPGGVDPGGRLYKTGDLARIGDGGLIYFVGRADSQIKSRGYRIELGEIEAALNTIEGVREAAAVAIATQGFEGVLIGCAYTPVPGPSIAPAGLRAVLATLVPRYMVPARWLAFEDGLPKNGNGKIDRRALRERFESDATRPDLG